MLNEGNYRGRPVRAALGLTSTGKEQIGVQFEFVEPAGTRLTWYGYFTDAATERTVESLRHCGWRGDDLSVFAEGQPLPEGFDQEVELVVKHEEYQGKTSARIAFINGGGGLAMKEALTQDQASAFAKRMKSRIGAFDRAAGRAPAPTATQQQLPRPAAPRPAPAPRLAAAPSPADQPPQELLDEQAGQQDDVPF
jgi:hypothetical protein